MCKHVYYSGRVQGVGFRYTAQQIAQRFPIAGFVRNLPGGEVELVAEGEAAAVEGFLSALAARMSENISTTRIEDEAPGGHQDFNVRY
ncbi:MAG: acylphosphatase [Gemmataceae bacterium]